MARKKEFNPISTLEKAMELFWLKGYAATSIDDLCNVMGIKRGSLYNTYGDKRTLFFQALEHYVHKYNQRSTDAVPSVSGYHSIQMIFQAVVDDTVNETDCRGCLVVNTITELAATDVAIADFGEARRQDYEEMFHELLTVAEENGEIAHNQDLTALAQFLVNAFYGLRVTAKVNQDRALLENIVQITMAAIK